jgi:hypothetical protein
MRLVSLTTSLFFILFALIAALHGRVIRKRDTSGTTYLSTDDGDQQPTVSTLSPGEYRELLRRRKFRMFKKK